MKKLIVVLAVAMTMSAASAFAIGTSSAAVPVVKGFNKTNKVNVYYIGNSDGNAWASVSAHEGGDKEYWTSSAYGGVAYKTVVPGTGNGTVASGAPATPTDSSMASGYTSM